MIVIKLFGGLGNQMFQYALGRHLSILLNSSLVLDKSTYNNKNYRHYLLDNFLIRGELQSTTLLSRVLNKFMIKFKLLKIYKESSGRFYEGILKVPNNSILEGYWQSEKYFKSIGQSIRQDFTFKKAKIFSDLPISRQIKSSNAVSVHIRRGDRVTNPMFNQIHGICDIEYYNKSIEFIKGRIKDPIFCFFSEDIDWVKSNIRILYPHIYIDSHYYPEIVADSTIIDLFLMSQCKHNIIANSTFSWWGAWLNINPNKIVIAPQIFYCDETIDTSDLLPKTWIKI